MPEINLLWWLMLILLAVVAGCLLAAAKNADAADCEALRCLAAASGGKSAPPRFLPHPRRVADPQQPERAYPERMQKRPAASFFSVGLHGRPADESRQGLQAVICYELPRLAGRDAKKAAASDCPYCA